MRARARASDAIHALLDLAPPTAAVLRDGNEVEIPTAQIVAGDIVVIRPGGKISTPVLDRLLSGLISVSSRDRFRRYRKMASHVLEKKSVARMRQ